MLNFPSSKGIKGKVNLRTTKKDTFQKDLCKKDDNNKSNKRI